MSNCKVQNTPLTIVFGAFIHRISLESPSRLHYSFYLLINFLFWNIAKFSSSWIEYKDKALEKGNFSGKKMAKKEKREDFGYFNTVRKLWTFLEERMFPSKGIIILTMVAVFLIEIVLRLWLGGI